MRSMRSKNFNMSNATHNNVSQLSLNSSRIRTFKDENIEEHFIENNDNDFEKIFLIYRMKTI